MPLPDPKSVGLIGENIAAKQRTGSTIKQNMVTMYGLSAIPIVRLGDDLGSLIVEAAEKDNIPIENGNIVVVAQKVVSISEGAVRSLGDVHPSKRALELAKQTGRDPRLCQVYLDESSEVTEVVGRMVITRHRLGFVCSGAGVDRSNVAPHSEGRVVLLPQNPDLSALGIRKKILQRIKKSVAVIINDSFGREFRDGSVGTAIGISGIRHIEERIQRDLYGNPSNSRIALVDELAAGASILMGQADEKIPVVIINGVNYQSSEDSRLTDILNEPKIKEGK
jgi:coenzyme F420-0:L-glutamate ligase/coenzyme F420-1:gamma-L-glutamate ligase